MLSVFVDSDVVVSSLISSRGAAYQVVHAKGLDRWISDVSTNEIREVVIRLKLPQKNLTRWLVHQFSQIKLTLSHKEIQKRYGIYTSDSNDSHIVAGAHQSRVRFLITYNRKHFRADEIKENLRIIVLTPAEFLQYLRSLS